MAAIQLELILLIKSIKTRESAVLGIDGAILLSIFNKFCHLIKNCVCITVADFV